ncbi:hypothetical protein [Sphaerisporangium fuscum]|nr:hypothetical protein [Sphaerisporangium fuscum]
MIARTSDLPVSAKVTGDHGSNPREGFRAVNGPVRGAAAAHGPEVR